MLYLLETPAGIALFLCKSENNTAEHQETTLLDKIKYSSISETLTVNRELSEGIIPQILVDFLNKNLCSSGLAQTQTLNILNPELVQTISSQFGLKVISTIDENFRKIRKNSFKFFEISKEQYNDLTSKIANKLTSTSHDDLLMIDILNSIEELEKSINNRIMRVREWYSLHFPELNSVPDHSTYLKYLLEIGNRTEYKSKEGSSIPEEIIYQMNNSMGCEITDEDMSKIRQNVENILKDIGFRSRQSLLLRKKAMNAFPNLFNLVGENLTAKMIRKAGSITLLSQCPSSTIQIYGSEKAFHEAVKTEAPTPKYGFIYDSSLVFRASEDIKGKVARLLACKIALCARVDAGKAEDGSFGQKQKERVEKEIEKLEDRKVKQKKNVKQVKKRHISVKEYDSSRDTKGKVNE